jgi:hypothetical protein
VSAGISSAMTCISAVNRRAMCIFAKTGACGGIVSVCRASTPA